MATIETNEDGTPKESVKPTEENLTAEQLAAQASEKPNEEVVKPEIPAEQVENELDLTAVPEVVAEPFETGNAALDSVGALLISKDVDTKVLDTFMEKGEFSIEEKAAIIEGLGEATANLVFDKLTTEVANVKAKNVKARTATLEYAASVFEGAAVDTIWEQIQTYVRNPENGFDAETKAELSGLLKQGGIRSKMALDYIAKQYYSNPNTTSRADLVAGDTYVTGQFKSLSSKEYSTEVKKAIREHGENSNQVQDLRRRRELSRNQGIR